MALIKTIPDPYGTGTIDAYVRWATLVVEPLRRSITATFAVYQSAEAREAGKEPMTWMTFGMQGPEYDEFAAGEGMGAADSIGNLVYGYAKAQPDLAGAGDA